jgi:hypothetical protein
MSVLRSYNQWTPPILIKHYTAADDVLSMESIVVWSKTISKFVRLLLGYLILLSYTEILNILSVYRETWKPWDPWLKLFPYLKYIELWVSSIHSITYSPISLVNQPYYLWGEGKKKHIFHALCLTHSVSCEGGVCACVSRKKIKVWFTKLLPNVMLQFRTANLSS